MLRSVDVRAWSGRTQADSAEDALDRSAPTDPPHDRMWTSRRKVAA